MRSFHKYLMQILHSMLHIYIYEFKFNRFKTEKPLLPCDMIIL